MYFDTHAHYYDDAFDADRDQVLAALPAAGVELALCPGCDLESSRQSVALAERYPHLYAAVGLHPENLEGASLSDLAEVEAMAAHRPVVATNVGACREIIEGAGDGLGPAGRVVPVMSPTAIADNILAISRSPAQLRALAENGYRRVKRFYQDKDFLAAYRSLYREAVQSENREVNHPWQASALN